MADMNELKNMIRKGTVQSVNDITEWVPKVGDLVLCLMIPDGDGEGYIVGKVM